MKCMICGSENEKTDYYQFCYSDDDEYLEIRSSLKRQEELFICAKCLNASNEYHQCEKCEVVFPAESVKIVGYGDAVLCLKHAAEYERKHSNSEEYPDLDDMFENRFKDN